ncbi:Phytochrome-like protein cph2 [Enhygromyxa salina]|uniref:Phytochrome-like protein cph2 n=1 Tax=Enhygromyxa salina TaxID=215803 RepID=A0A2S9YCT9_9BACT|nr:GGDEF domain-containing phosphodiesterase [Enhygromyxa salina]PRQ02938.1 Phytochrome-like protein cph2 [Enhygromyxa salina]
MAIRGARGGPSGRSPGRVRVGSVSSTSEIPQVVRGADLVVTGDHDISGEVAGWLTALRPPVHVRHVSRADSLDVLAAAVHQTTSPESSTAVENPEVILAAVELLDTTSLGWMRSMVANTRLPLIVVVSAHSAQRSALREQAREIGAIDCLLRDELSSPLLEASIAHARSHNLQVSRLVELRERFALAIRGARDGMWEWDLRRGRVYYSQRWRELLNLRNADVAPTLDSWLARVHPQDVERLRADLDANLEGRIAVHENEHRIRDGNNEWRWVLTRGVVDRSRDGRPLRMAGSLTDISPYRQREQALREQARHDSLTRLPDRRVFLERCARAIELSRAHDDYMFVVLLIAVDRLAQLRDSYGVAAADQVFAIMAKRLRACLRPEDHMFRFSTGKLAILIEDVEDPGFGTSVANRIHAAAAEPFEVEGATNFTTVSIGMTSSAHGYSRVEEVVADVSAATDSARDRGRNRYEIYDTSMRIESRTLLALEMAIRHAIDSEQFRLHYQPLVQIDQNTLLGFEALLRWDHPERGRISPAEFIPIAEDTGLIIPLGRWVIRDAIRTLHSWHEEFGVDHLVVSVNLSAKQVADPMLLETIDSALAETGLPPQCLKLELTESVMMDRVDEVTTLLQQIRARGVALWIDDFGTGYSSLGYLHRFPVDGLKIDRAFVSELDGTPESETMVRTILSLAANLGLSVIAEGIETEEQAAQLEKLGCLCCQGWLFGKAQEPEQIRAGLA